MKLDKKKQKMVVLEMCKICDNKGVKCTSKKSGGGGENPNFKKDSLPIKPSQKLSIKLGNKEGF